MRQNKPNILMIICHDLGQHLGCYGAGINTPNIDQLAHEGVLFTNYHCAAAQCSPSRGSILTGRYPHRNGLIGLAHLGWELNEGEKTLPMYLKAAGYSTHLLGVQHETGGDPRALGYDRVEIPSIKAEELAAAACEFIRAQAAVAHNEPFFLNMGTFEPHRPYEIESYQRDNPAEVSLLPWLPDRPGIRQDIADLNGLVYAVDGAVGMISETLDETGIADNTLLIFTTDHGLAMPRAKGTCYDPGTKTALILRLPSRWDDGSTHEELLSNCDLLPTILELVGQPIPEEIDGRSFLNLLDGTGYAQRDRVFVEMTWHDLYNPMRCIRTDGFKYIRNFGDLPLVYLPKDVWMGRAGGELRDTYYAARRPAEELYDLRADPLETSNLAGDPAHAETLATLRARIDEWMRETGDRLLEGDWPPNEKQSEIIRERGDKELGKRWLEASKGTLTALL